MDSRLRRSVLRTALCASVGAAGLGANRTNGAQSYSIGLLVSIVWAPASRRHSCVYKLLLLIGILETHRGCKCLTGHNESGPIPANSRQSTIGDWPNGFRDLNWQNALPARPGAAVRVIQFQNCNAARQTGRTLYTAVPFRR